MKKIFRMFKRFFLTKKAKKLQRAVVFSEVLVAELAFDKDVENGLEKLGDYVQTSSWYGKKILPLLEDLTFRNRKRQQFVDDLKAILSETAPSEDGWNRTPPEHGTYPENIFVKIPDSWSRLLCSRSVVEYFQKKSDLSRDFAGLNEYYFIEKMFVNPFIHDNYSKLSKVVAEYTGKKPV